MELIWAGAAYLAGLITSRLFLPPLLGYLMSGYVLNVAGVEANETLKHLANIGIELLLFTVGLK
ncbi:MAG: cation:proton antiporter domain-containing protein [Methylobacter sp.]